MEIEGLIEDFYLPVDFDLEEGWIQIEGYGDSIAIDGKTEIEGNLEVGLMTEVEAVVQSDDFLLATEIEVEEEGEASFKLASSAIYSSEGISFDASSIPLSLLLTSSCLFFTSRIKPVGWL